MKPSEIGLTANLKERKFNGCLERKHDQDMSVESWTKSRVVMALTHL